MGLFGKRRSSSQWPSAAAVLDEIYVVAEGANIAEGSGYFTVAGDYYSILVRREFKSAREAEAWVSRTETSPHVTVRYNPDDPSDNVLDEQAF